MAVVVGSAVVTVVLAAELAVLVAADDASVTGGFDVVSVAFGGCVDAIDVAADVANVIEKISKNDALQDPRMD